VSTLRSDAQEAAFTSGRPLDYLPGLLLLVGVGVLIGLVVLGFALYWAARGQADVSKWAFLLTFAGAGLTTDIRQIARTGWRPLVVAIIGLTVVASVSLGLVLLTSRVFHWGVTT
jgi:uncharacterized membrane protein YadS